MLQTHQPAGAFQVINKQEKEGERQRVKEGKRDRGGGGGGGGFRKRVERGRRI